ncbi:AfsR/SARP family transcriptional regulator [Nonomuraea sp. LPB2021202275-12-8]|uniref:AfsR/SARP family transcriptional regulator n=1 Tax=Nonomuraea sp. LPB2021202275-12-8 TaxID=3120159 RepID=UPI00300CF16C
MADRIPDVSADFRMLGPLEAHADGLQLVLPGRHVRWLLGALLLDAPERVTENQLLARVWGPQGGSTAALRTAASRLRAWLHDQAGLQDVVRFTGGGYRLALPALWVDAGRFQARLAAARLHDDPIPLLGEALALWRGGVLADAPEWLRTDPAALQLDQERLSCARALADLALSSGRAPEVLAMVEAVAARFPYDESIQARLLSLLGACGRRAEALHRFESIRRRLAADLGVDPSPLLRDAHTALLRDPPERRSAVPAPAAPASAPCLLPPDIADFTGRTAEAELLTRVLLDGEGTALPVAAVSGRAGVGKTALVVHVSHLLRGGFPDGQLYVNLRGSHAEPTDPSEALGRFLRALGAGAADIPASLDERAELFRGLLAHRRLLVLLDDAADPGQVEPLLPGVPTCGVLVTSRKRLTPLAGARDVQLDVLDPEQAVALLARIAGAGRVHTEEETAHRLAALAGHLPLALRVAGARLAAKSHWSVGQLASRLADERRRLDELAFGQLDVRASLTLTYHALEPAARRALHALSLLDAPDFAAWAAAALLDCSQSEAEDAVEELVDAQLLDVEGGAGRGLPRYRFHDLVRIYARERAETTLRPQEHADALARACGAWLYLAEHAYRGVYGGDYQMVHGDAPRWIPDGGVQDSVAADPLSWLESERLALVATTGQAIRTGRVELAWDLAGTCSPMFTIRDHTQEPSQTLSSVLAATRHDQLGQAVVLFRLGLLRADQERYDDAGDCFERSLRLFGELGHRHGHALALSYAAALDQYLGNSDLALRRLNEALDGLREAGDHGGEAYCLRNIGQIHLESGDFPNAHAYLGEALAISERSGSPRNGAQALFWLGTLQLRQGRLEAAEAAFGQVLTTASDIGDATGQAMGLLGLGEVRTRLGAHDDAIRALLDALEIGQAIPSRRIQIRALHALGRAAHECDRDHLRGQEHTQHDQGRAQPNAYGYGQAVRWLEEAACLAGELGVRAQAARVLRTLGEVHQTAGHATAAGAAWREALTLFEALGSPEAAQVKLALG